MKRLLAIILVLITVFSLSACCMKHEYTEPTCTEPATCSLCGKTDGEALGHDWADADCEHPKTCSRCGETEGEALGHDWVDATCETPQTCSRCGATEGEPIAHHWVGRTTEDAGTCSLCGVAGDSPIIITEIEPPKIEGKNTGWWNAETLDNNIAYIGWIDTDDDQTIILFNDKKEEIRRDVLDKNSGYSCSGETYYYMISTNYNHETKKAGYTILDYSGNVVYKGTAYYGSTYLVFDDTPIDGVYNVHPKDDMLIFEYIDVNLKEPAKSIFDDEKQEMTVYSSITDSSFVRRFSSVDDGIYFDDPVEYYSDYDYDTELWSYYRPSTHEGYIFVGSKDGKDWGFLDESGNELAMYADVSDFGDCGYALATNDRKTYFLIDTDFNVVGENVVSGTGASHVCKNIFNVKLKDSTYRHFTIE